MPELIEVELYRRAALALIGRTIVGIDANDAWYLKEGTEAHQLADVALGCTVVTADRIGKLLLLGISRDVEQSALRESVPDHRIGLRFGMTGRLVIDGGSVIDELLYSSPKSDPAFVRFSLRFADGGRAEMSDPRRLGGVALDPSTSSLGPDAATLSLDELRVALAGSDAPLKARLLDQARIAGIGNLLADQMLWRARISPLVAAGSVRGERLIRLHRAVVDTIEELQSRGGSHTGDLAVGSRHRDGRCPRCGRPLRRDQVGGRTTYWCGAEQR